MQRQGLTLVELLVVLVIITILASLALVGTQSIRESGRKFSCSNNLKQIGLALQNYHSTHKCLPAGASPQLALSPLVAILPYIEQQSLYNTIDFSVDDFELIGPAMKTKVSLYRCPSTLEQQLPRTDYALNRGTTLVNPRDDPWYMNERSYPKLESFTNGSSKTALFAEICPRVEGSPYGAYYQLPRRIVGSSLDEEAIIRECRSANSRSGLSTHSNGRTWIGTGVLNYYHFCLPNEKSCANGGLAQFSVEAAISMHAGGVNCLFADGHVEFESSQISSELWMSLGSR